MTKTAITNDKPKDDPSLASQIGLIVAMELGRALGRTEVTNEQKEAPAKLGNRFTPPAGAQTSYRAPKADFALPDGDEPVTNASQEPVRVGGFLVPKAD